MVGGGGRIFFIFPLFPLCSLEVPNGFLSSQYVPQGWEWERTHLLICVYEWERELTSLPPFRPITRRTNLLANRILDGRTDGHTRFSAETLNPKPGHTQEDTHYTEWYRYPEWFFLSLTVLTTHPRVYPLHWGTLFSSQTNRTLSDTHYPEFF